MVCFSRDCLQEISLEKLQYILRIIDQVSEANIVVSSHLDKRLLCMFIDQVICPIDFSVK
jgi:hypothetical protein